MSNIKQLMNLARLAAEPINGKVEPDTYDKILQEYGGIRADDATREDLQSVAMRAVRIWWDTADDPIKDVYESLDEFVDEVLNVVNVFSVGKYMHSLWRYLKRAVSDATFSGFHDVFYGSTIGTNVDSLFEHLNKEPEDVEYLYWSSPLYTKFADGGLIDEIKIIRESCAADVVIEDTTVNKVFIFGHACFKNNPSKKYVPVAWSGDLLLVKPIEGYPVCVYRKSGFYGCASIDTYDNHIIVSHADKAPMELVENGFVLL